MKKIILFISFLLIGSILWMWYYGPNCFLSLPGKPQIEKNAVQMPIKKFIIFKDNDRYAAVKIIRLKWNKGAVYECYYQGDGSGNFNSKSASYQEGEVYENYTKMLISSTETSLKDRESKLNIECGTFKIEWSYQNWIYFKGYGVKGTSYLISPTMVSDISQISVFSKNLEWISEKRSNISP